MTIRRLSLALVLLSTNCGLQSPFASAPSADEPGGTAGHAASSAGTAGTGAAGPYGAGQSGVGGIAGLGGRSGASGSSPAGVGAAIGTSTNAGSGLASGAGGLDQRNVFGQGAAGGSAGSAGPNDASGGDAGTIPIDAALAVPSASGHVEQAPGDGRLTSTVVFPDAGVITYPDDPSIPAPLPSAPGTPVQPGGGQSPAVGAGIDDVTRYTIDGCGQPPACCLRASIVTLAGHAYGASFSSNYPKDNCARDYIKDDNTILIGDTFRTAAARQCVAGGPSISVAFNVDYWVWYLSLGFDTVWSSDDGFRSEWQLANASAADSGSYYPFPGANSRLEFFGAGRSLSGESVGQLQVPLFNSQTGTLAVGYLQFDVLVR